MLFCFTTRVWAFNLNQVSVKLLAQTYGYLQGQEHTLTRITKKYPELLTNVELARMEFNLTFPNISKKIEALLINTMEEEKFNAFKKKIKGKLSETLKSQKITKQIAIAFIRNVKNRSKGNIDSPVLEYLLAVNYENNPVSEFLDGFIQRFQTDGSGKSQGIILNLKLPSSWKGGNGERPHIVQKWVSQNGTGLEFIMLDIRDAKGFSPKRSDIDLLISSSEIKEFVPQGATYINSGKFSLEQQTGFWIETKFQMERVGIDIYQNQLTYYLFFYEKAIGIMCQTGGLPKNKRQVDKNFNLIRPLCQQVLNSLVLDQSYEPLTIQ